MHKKKMEFSKFELDPFTFHLWLSFILQKSCLGLDCPLLTLKLGERRTVLWLYLCKLSRGCFTKILSLIYL